MEFFETVRQVKSNWEPYKKWDIEQRKKDKQNILLKEKYPPSPKELSYAKEYGRTLVESINTMDQHSIDKAEDAAFAVQNAMKFIVSSSMAIGGVLGFSENFLKFLKPTTEKRIAGGFVGMIIGASIASIFTHIWGSTIEKQASRIARFQTRNNDLKDYRNFVVYTDEQVARAKEIAKTLPEVADTSRNMTLKKSLNPIVTFKKAIETSKSLSRDYKKYEEWKETFTKQETLKKEQFKQITLDDATKSKAEKDRENLLGTIKKIENSSLNYLMDMRLAFLTVAVALGASATGVGFAAVKAVDLLEKKKIIKPDSIESLGTKAFGLKVVPLATLMLLIGPMIKLQKDAARIGRYKAKQQMLSDPANFIAYDDKQRKNVESQVEVEPVNSGFVKAFKRDLANVKKLKGDYVDYQKYLDGQRKEELKLQEALKQVEITSEQKEQAKKLQHDAFYSFEKMDEKAQRCTDDTEAAVGITRNIIGGFLSCAAKIISLSILMKKLHKYNLKPLENMKDFANSALKLKGNDLIQFALPMLATSLIKLPIAVRGLQIEKEAGKIGVMQAMNDMDDPKNFV